MHKRGVGNFPYYVGINSLAEVATHEDRVCVLNILGSESSKVTPISHAFSGGNVVFGTGPGKSGKYLETPLGNIPVYNSVKEGRLAGHKFNTAVVYLPPSGVKDGVAEVVRQNPDLKKIVIITEKVSIKDARIIRAICQTNGIDVFGANCLGVADTWNKVRIGGALGGNKPEESLVKGSIAIYSNSGNFTTTIAVYLLTKGWGTTTSISSGKDVYIHFALREFLYALDNDERTKASVVYTEPGGYYEQGAWSKKPIIACIVGRWKARLTRACGHAGSLAGSGDDARAKETWFMDYLEVDDIFTPKRPIFSKKGAVVTNIAHIPEALTMVMAENKIKPDFEPRGDLSLKCWLGSNQGLKLPLELDVPVVTPIKPYNEQIEILGSQIGAVYPRQSLKDASGASMMDPKTQVTKVHNISILDTSKYPFESNLVMSLLKDYPEKREQRLTNIILNSLVNMYNDPALAAANAARESENSPNTVISSAISIIGKGRVKEAIDAVSTMLELCQFTIKEDPFASIDFSNEIDRVVNSDKKEVFLSNKEESRTDIVLKVISKEKIDPILIGFLKAIAEKTNLHIKFNALLAAICITIGWNALKKKKVSKNTILYLPWYFKLFSSVIGASVASERHTEDAFSGISITELINNWSFGEVAFLALTGYRPSKEELFEFNILLGLIISNGPGTISAQGAKGAVSADGPEQPDRVQINKAFVGFLTHTGFAHGGNGFEGIAFLLDIFKDKELADAGIKNPDIDLRKIAINYAERYLVYKSKEKSVGNMEYKKIPCINHPVFKGKEINIDPREEFVKKILEGRGSYNIFLDFYHHLVNALFETGVSKDIYCVNVDAVIAVILLKTVWKRLKAGKFSEKEIENAAFTTFLFGRMIGSAAEIDDHINRGTNMDTRTPASKCLFVT